ncbi:hypothetical protein F5888DRAFT_674240 [Russula emetica]|nr:hypothetical protein F5888DRAFT_674240 [Russula emetica]
MPPDHEMGGGPGGPDDSGDYPEQPLQDKSNFGDSSWPLFSIYSDAAKHEDKEMVERWHKDAEGIIFFTSLFSAAVAVLLSVTVQDLRPGIQDTSAFYLGNIYQVLADPNVTRSSIPSPTAKPPPFSPPRYAVWVNSLWFLSLVMSLSCALWATSLQQWARRHLRRVHPARCRPEKRARMRAFFAKGVEKVHIPLAVEGLPTLLHLSVFFFFGGLAIFLFNVDRDVFSYVVWWIGPFSSLYGIITLLPIVWHDCTYYSPFSTPAWILAYGIAFVTFKILAFISYGLGRGSYSTSKRYNYLGDCYRHRMLRG